MPDRRSTRWMRIRLFIVVGTLLFFTGLLSIRIWTLQISQSAWLEGLAREQYLKEIALEPMRGAILDRRGTPVAVSVMTESIFAMPQEMEDSASVAASLGATLGISPSRLANKLSARKHFTWIKRRVAPAEAERVRGLILPGVHFTKESRRFYPARDLAASLVGFAGDGRGLEGLELFFDGHLKGAVVLAQGLRDAFGNVLYSDGVNPQEAAAGGEIVLAIDLTVQEITERELQRAVRDSGARNGTAIVIDPSTGEVLAMANTPAFNPNSYWKHKPAQWRNRAVTDCYEPGSTFKILVMAASLQNGTVRLNDKIDCQQGSLELSKYTIRDAHIQGFGSLTPAEILIHSSNIGMAKIGLRMGREALYQALKRFGIGRKTGVDLPGETACVLGPAKKWSDVGVATVSFGQGLSVTPLQLITAAGAIANGGVWMRPIVVKEVRGPKDEVLQRFDPEPAGQVVEARWAKVVREMMVATTQPGGTGEAGAIPGFEVAGKTGTAQKVDPIAGGYSKDKRVASFVGFVPAAKPRIAILVVVDEPTTNPYGGVVAAPAFARIAEATLNYLGVFPTQAPLSPRPVEVANQEAAERPIAAVVDPLPEAPLEVSSGRLSPLPDLRGLSVREALKALTNRGSEVMVAGSGKVVQQHPAPGSVLRSAEPVSLVLEREAGTEPAGVGQSDGLR